MGCLGLFRKLHSKGLKSLKRSDRAYIIYNLTIDNLLLIYQLGYYFLPSLWGEGPGVRLSLYALTLPFIPFMLQLS